MVFFKYNVHSDSGKYSSEGIFLSNIYTYINIIYTFFSGVGRCFSMGGLQLGYVFCDLHVFMEKSHF